MPGLPPILSPVGMLLGVLPDSPDQNHDEEHYDDEDQS